MLVVNLKCSMLNKMPGLEDDKYRNLRVGYAFMMGHPGKKLLKSFAILILMFAGDWRGQEGPITVHEITCGKGSRSDLFKNLFGHADIAVCYAVFFQYLFHPKHTEFAVRQH